MEMTDKTKKILIYGGGAASIVALYLYVRNRNAARSASGFAPGTGTSAGGGASGNPETAAQINAATQLAIAQGSQDIAKANIQASTTIAGLQSQTALGVAGIQASATRAAATTGALGQVLAGPASSAGGTAIKGLFDLLGNAVKGIFGPNAAEKLGFPKGGIGEPGTTPILLSPEGYSSPGSSFISPYVYSPKGEAFGLSGANADYYMGNTGSGDSSWYGIGKNDPTYGDFNPYYFNEPGFVGPADPFLTYVPGSIYPSGDPSLSGYEGE